jgi:hypothetical protein
MGGKALQEQFQFPWGLGVQPGKAGGGELIEATNNSKCNSSSYKNTRYKNKSRDRTTEIRITI